MLSDRQRELCFTLRNSYWSFVDVFRWRACPFESENNDRQNKQFHFDSWLQFSIEIQISFNFLWMYVELELNSRIELYTDIQETYTCQFILNFMLPSEIGAKLLVLERRVFIAFSYQKLATLYWPMSNYVELCRVRIIAFTDVYYLHVIDSSKGVLNIIHKFSLVEPNCVHGPIFTMVWTSAPNHHLDFFCSHGFVWNFLLDILENTVLSNLSTSRTGLKYKLLIKIRLLYWIRKCLSFLLLINLA